MPQSLRNHRDLVRTRGHEGAVVPAQSLNAGTPRRYDVFTGSEPDDLAQLLADYAKRAAMPGESWRKDERVVRVWLDGAATGEPPVSEERQFLLAQAISTVTQAVSGDREVPVEEFSRALELCGYNGMHKLKDVLAAGKQIGKSVQKRNCCEGK